MVEPPAEKQPAAGRFFAVIPAGLYLDNDDYGMLQAYFPEPYSVFLLVRPVPGTVGSAGFFFWQDGDIHRESSFLEFPFHVSRLPLGLGHPAPAPTAINVSMKPLAGTVPALAPALRPRPAATPPPVAAKTASFGQDWVTMAIVPAAIVLFSVTFYAARHQSGRDNRVPSPPAAVSAPAADEAARSVKPSPLETKPPEPEPIVTRYSVPNTGARGTAARDRDEEEDAEPPAPVAKVEPAAPDPAPSAVDIPAVTAPAQVTPPLEAIVSPERTEMPPAQAPTASVTVEPVGEGKLGRLVGHIPGLRRLGRRSRASFRHELSNRFRRRSPPARNLLETWLSI